MSDSPDFIAGIQRGEMAADNFTIVSNLVARDPNLSYKAKGLFLNLASHKRGFEITEDLLLRQGRDSKDSIRSGLRELCAAGYVYRGERRKRPAGTKDTKGRSIGGTLGPYPYFVTDRPDEVAKILEQNEKETAGHVQGGFSDVDATRQDAAAS